MSIKKQFIQYSQNWGNSDYQVFNRIVEGLYACCLSLRKFPVIRYQGSSDACQKVANSLAVYIYVNEKFNNKSSRFLQDKKCLLLITDRKEDPVTPLLNQWTYQAMLHELIGIDKNILDIKKVNKSFSSKKAEESEFVISAYQDQFFQKNMYSNFGELASNIKEYIDEMSNARSKSITIKSLDDMQRALDALPELKQMSGNVQKHVTLTSEISKLVEDRQLLEVSKAEQELACKENQKEHFKMVWDCIKNPRVEVYDKLRLVTLYQLRYENDEKVGNMKEKLRELGVQNASINMINLCLEYAGKKQRSGDLFSNKDLFSLTKNILKQTFKEVPNVYTQHTPYVIKLLELLEKSKLKEGEFPTVNPSNHLGIDQVIVFTLGGTTYEEAKAVGEKNRSLNQNKYILGGSSILNSRQFYAEVSQINNSNFSQDDIQGQKSKGGFFNLQ